MKYKLVTYGALFKKQFEEEGEMLLKQGWKLVGNAHISANGTLYQTLIHK